MQGPAQMEAAGVAPLLWSVAAITAPRVFHYPRLRASRLFVNMVLEVELLKDPVRHLQAVTRTSTFHRYTSLSLRMVTVMVDGVVALPPNARMVPAPHLRDLGHFWGVEVAAPLS